MQACQIKISTAVDGEEKKIVRRGSISRGDEVVLQYEEENAKVKITLRNQRALLEREGEYGLRLPLEEGKTTEGALSLSGAHGDIPVHTQKVAYVFEEKGGEIELHYQLLFGEEKQDMRLRIWIKI